MSSFITIIKILLESLVTIGILDVILYTVKFLKVRASSEEQKKALADIETAVSAAEQLYASGEEKKAYVEQLLTNMGYEINDRINMMIEGSVNKLFPQGIFNIPDSEEDEIETDYEE